MNVAWGPALEGLGHGDWVRSMSDTGQRYAGITGTRTGTRRRAEAKVSALQGRCRAPVAGLRGFTGFPPPPNALARPRAGRVPRRNRAEQTPLKAANPAHAVPRSPPYWPWSWCPCLLPLVVQRAAVSWGSLRYFRTTHKRPKRTTLLNDARMAVWTYS
jgi:hypothetical protein